MRLRKVRGAIDELLTYTEHFVDLPEENKGKWREFFGNDNPLHVEFGGGKGQFIIGMAEKNPDINYLSIDLYTEVLLKAVKKADKSPAKNVRFLQYDINHVFDLFEENELDRVYLNFSDPWPKNRHAKRRLTHRNFLDKYKVVLKEEGWVHFKTDNRGLFQFTLNECADLNLKMQAISLNLHEEPELDNVMTEYEEKFSKRGMPIYRIEFSLKNR